MKRFAFFQKGKPMPIATYAGEFMKRDKEFVEIRNYGTVENPDGELVAAIRLGDGDDVRQMPETSV